MIAVLQQFSFDTAKYLRKMYSIILERLMGEQESIPLYLATLLLHTITLLGKLKPVLVLLGSTDVPTSWHQQTHDIPWGYDPPLRSEVNDLVTQECLVMHGLL